MTMIVVNLEIDWELLRRQKRAVVGLRTGTVVSAEQEDAAEGLLNLLDKIQDQAADSGEVTDEEAFGESEDLGSPSSVGKLDAFWYRVNFACAVIARNGAMTRNFDTCFEMYDGDAVAAAVVRRAMASPTGRLARNVIPRYLGPRAIESYEATKHMNRKELEQYAARLREAAIRERDAWRAAERAAGRLAPLTNEQACTNVAA